MFDIQSSDPVKRHKCFNKYNSCNAQNFLAISLVNQAVFTCMAIYREASA